MLTVTEIAQSASSQWNDFVLSHTESDYSHLYEWKEIFENSYDLKTAYLGIYDDSILQAILPMVIIEYPFISKKAFSLPYLNYSGLLHIKSAERETFLKIVLGYLKKINISTIELRNFDILGRRNEGLCTLKLPLPKGSSILWDGLKSKVRNQIRKAQKYGFRSEWNVGQIDQFYKIYSQNMRDLGTPVHSKKFFILIIEKLGKMVDILTIYKDDLPVSSMLLIKYKKTLSDPWASSLKEFLPHCPNMLMYWEALKYGAENDFIEFDFGRSEFGSGTFNFKTQWGASPLNLDYIVYSNDGELRKPVTSIYKKDKVQYLTAFWKIMPLPFANWLGPKIRKYVP